LAEAAAYKGIANAFPILASHLLAQEQQIAELRNALRPAEEGGLHVRVNIEGVTTSEHFRRVITEIANDLEIQKQQALAKFPKKP